MIKKRYIRSAHQKHHDQENSADLRIDAFEKMRVYQNCS